MEEVNEGEVPARVDQVEDVLSFHGLEQSFRSEIRWGP